jgi:hypothetical protein
MEEGSVIPARNREDLDSSREITKAVDQGFLSETCRLLHIVQRSHHSHLRTHSSTYEAQVRQVYPGGHPMQRPSAVVADLSSLFFPLPRSASVYLLGHWGLSSGRLISCISKQRPGLVKCDVILTDFWRQESRDSR